MSFVARCAKPNDVSVNGMVSYERLEFLGDAVLAMVASKELFDSFSDDTPGQLTIKRQQYVRVCRCYCWWVFPLSFVSCFLNLGHRQNE